MIHSYGLFKSLKNILPSASTILVVGCGPVSPNHEIDWFLKHYPTSKIWAFEPVPGLFNALSARYAKNARVTMVSAAVTDLDGVIKFRVNNPIGASSLLPWDESGDKPKSWTTISEIDVIACSLDEFCESNHIDHIDLLFMDAQGAEVSILIGADRLRKEKRINVVVGEAIFTDLYGTPHSFSQVYNRLTWTGDYQFWGFYRPVYGNNGRLHHCDYIFRRKP